MSTSILYFAYDASLDPERISMAAPGARFAFTAHYPETRLTFVSRPVGGPAIPTLVRDPGSTVWGAVFEVPAGEVEGLISGLSDGRSAGFDQKAVDREGNKYDCLTFVSDDPVSDDPVSETAPDADYVESMIRGAKHWSLPAGWVLGLEDLADDPLAG